MKRLLTLLITLFVSLILSAQNISVASFSLLENDLTANTQGTIVYDQNGEKCALIKVETTQTGFSFDAGSLGVRKTEQHPAEVWVYVPEGVKRLTISHPQLGIIRDYDLGTTVQKAKTYLLKLTTGKVMTVVEDAVTSQFLVIRTEPSNAMVMVNDEVWNVFDGVARKWVPFGTYTYRVMAQDYFPEVGQVSVNSSTEKTEIDVVLKPNFTTITFQCADDVEIWFMGEKKGTGTWSGTLGECDLEVETRKTGYRDALTKCHIVPKDGPQTIKLNEPTPKYGSLMVSTLPNDADIFLDGDSVGRTPMLIPHVLEGTHIVRVSKNGYNDLSKEVAVVEAQQITIEESQSFGWFTDEKGRQYKGDWKDGKWHGKGILKFQNGDYYEGGFVNGKYDGKGVLKFQNGDYYEGGFVNGKYDGDGVYTQASGGFVKGLYKEGKLYSGNCKIIYANGGSYEGPILNDEYHGQGTWKSGEGMTYVGTFVNGKREGRGVFTWPNGDVYEGDFVAGLRNGKGTYKYNNGNSYEGDWKDGERTGYGIYKYAKGGSYEGYFLDNEFHGHGIMKFTEGGSYDGEWQNGNYHGQGTWKSKDGKIYTGTYVNGKREGKGVFTWPDGDNYDGDFVADYRTGKGIYKWSNGDVYEGDFIENKITGYGVKKYAEGGSYNGEWKDDNYNGQGVWVSKSGDTYTGSFVNGKREGYGTYIWADGGRYEGTWKNGTQDGKGVYTDKNGKKTKQKWANGNLQK